MHKILILGRYRTGTWRTFFLCCDAVGTAATYRDEFLKKYDGQQFDDGRLHEMIVDNTGKFDVAKILIHHFLDYPETEFKQLTCRYDRIIYMTRKNVLEQALSFCIARTLRSTVGTSRWRQTEVSEHPTVTIRHADMHEFVSKYWATKHIEDKILALPRTEVIAYEDIQYLSSNGVLQLLKIDGEAEDSVVKLDTYSQKMQMITNFVDIVGVFNDAMKIYGK